MKIIVVGSEGFFGSWLLPGLEKLGHSIVRFDSKLGDDLFDVVTLSERALGCDASIMLAAHPHFDEKIPPVSYMRMNVIGPAKVFCAMRNADVYQQIYVSSGAVYGFGQGRSPGWVVPPIREELEVTNWGQMDVYGASKLAMEAWLEEATPVKFSVVSLRVNCIEPHHVGAERGGAHWGWSCRQSTFINACNCVLYNGPSGFLKVNVGEDNPNLDLGVLRGMFPVEEEEAK